MAQKIADRIRQMAELLTEEQIARALSLDVDVVRGVLDGSVPDETLADFDPAKPPDVRVVETRRYVRSRVIGVVSPGGCGATTVAATLAVLALKNTGQPVLAVDLNEFAALGPALGLDAWRENAALYPNLGWFSGRLEDLLLEHPVLPGLHLALGAVTAERHAEIKDAETLLKEGAKRFATMIVDCPSSPRLWPAVLPECDYVFYVCRNDPASLAALWQSYPVLRACAVEERCGVVINFACREGGLSLRECRRLAEGMTVVGELPETPEIRTNPRFLIDKHKHKYFEAACSLVSELWPSEEKPKGLLAGLLGRRMA